MEFRKLPSTVWRTYFEAFTRSHLVSGVCTVAAQIARPASRQRERAGSGRVKAITYDPGGNVLEILVHGAQSLAYQPVDIWVVEEEDAFIRMLGIVRSDRTREIIELRRNGIRGLWI